MDGQQSRFDITHDVIILSRSQTILSTLHHRLLRLFPSEIRIRGNGCYACIRLFAYDGGLKLYQCYAVELPVTDTVTPLSKMYHPKFGKRTFA